MKTNFEIALEILKYNDVKYKMEKLPENNHIRLRTATSGYVEFDREGNLVKVVPLKKGE